MNNIYRKLISLNLKHSFIRVNQSKYITFIEYIEAFI